MLVNILGDTTQQEVAWLLTVMDPARFGARVPISMSTGAVPVTMYRATNETTAPVETSTATGEAFVMCNTDGWYGALSTLHIDGAASNVGVGTAATYAASVFPTAYGATTVGLAMPDVSANFTSSATTGTEYMQVGSSLQLFTVMPPAGAEEFTGLVTVFRTLDPERYPIYGAAPAALWTQATQQSSMIHAARYGIDPDGSFFLKETAANGGVTNSKRVGSLNVANLPLTVQAYQWQRIGAKTLSTVVDPHCTLGYYIQAPANTVLRARWISVYQSEMYPSSEIRKTQEAYGNSTSSSLTSYVTNLLPWQKGGMKPVGTPSRPLATVGSAIQNAVANNPGLGQAIIDHGSQALQGVAAAGGAKTLWDGLKGIFKKPASLPAAELHLPEIPTYLKMPSPPSTPSGWRGAVNVVEEGAEELGELAPELLEMALVL
jgi:hypothetical protein